jgi:propanediol dehydratase large subunit
MGAEGQEGWLLSKGTVARSARCVPAVRGAFMVVGRLRGASASAGVTAGSPIGCRAVA